LRPRCRPPDAGQRSGLHSSRNRWLCSGVAVKKAADPNGIDAVFFTGRAAGGFYLPATRSYSGYGSCSGPDASRHRPVAWLSYVPQRAILNGRRPVALASPRSRSCACAQTGRRAVARAYSVFILKRPGEIRRAGGDGKLSTERETRQAE